MSYCALLCQKKKKTKKNKKKLGRCGYFGWRQFTDSQLLKSSNANDLRCLLPVLDWMDIKEFETCSFRTLSKDHSMTYAVRSPFLIELIGWKCKNLKLAVTFSEDHSMIYAVQSWFLIELIGLKSKDLKLAVTLFEDCLMTYAVSSRFSMELIGWKSKNLKLAVILFEDCLLT